LAIDKNEQTSLLGSTVFVRNDNVEQALRKFKKKIQTSGLLLDLRAREFFEKPTSVRKRKKAQAKSRWQKELRSQTLPKKMY
jgi:small subunit ribosomal protein S21